mmetsp:Transcript_29714/g.78887  ORF Transcript_29714/g.78887 Transcript_29714/m.78887 type:complete len:224 (+) Transcript_29714:721-1392(+)
MSNQPPAPPYPDPATGHQPLLSATSTPALKTFSQKQSFASWFKPSKSQHCSSDRLSESFFSSSSFSKESLSAWALTNFLKARLTSPEAIRQEGRNVSLHILLPFITSLLSAQNGQNSTFPTVLGGHRHILKSIVALRGARKQCGTTSCSSAVRTSGRVGAGLEFSSDSGGPSGATSGLSSATMCTRTCARPAPSVSPARLATGTLKTNAPNRFTGTSAGRNVA